MKVALIHDWLTGMRGGERALEVFCERFPEADLFTLVQVPGAVSAIIEQRRVGTSFVQRLPFPGRFYRHYLPLFPMAIEQFDLDGYDLVLSTSHCAAKSVVVPGRTRHICYCLTPMRYAWDQFDAYFGPERLGRLGSRLLRPIMAGMARWDRGTAGRVHRYLAISQYVARRIALYYNRRSTIVYPPVDTSFYVPATLGTEELRNPGTQELKNPGTEEPRNPGTQELRNPGTQELRNPGTQELRNPGTPGSVEPQFLIVSALVPYKRVDLAIGAARRAGVRLAIVGDGPEKARLEAMAGGHVTFLGRRSSDEIRALYQSSIATLLPGEEDFGIVPLEAQACGRPVVALGRGGALETVVHDETGVLFDEPTEESLARGLTHAATRTWDRDRIRRNAERFNREQFARDITRVIDETMAAPTGVRW